MSNEIRKARIGALYAKDGGMALRYCHENPDIIAVY